MNGQQTLVVFDLDGTLLNSHSVVSTRTAQMLRQLSERNIAYTVATGRMLHDSQPLLSTHGFYLPHVFKNGVLVWRPQCGSYTQSNTLTHSDIHHIMEAIINEGIRPFIFTLEAGNHHAIFHLQPRTQPEKRLLKNYRRHPDTSLHPLSELPKHAVISNISAIGPMNIIKRAEDLIATEEHLVIYTGEAIEGKHLGWMDVHQNNASKGAAVLQIKRDIGATRLICFGDSDNDLSMFAVADECYAPDNATPEIKAAATAVIGHHNEDGIAEFLCRRFELDE